MKKLLLFAMMSILSISVMAQQKIQLRSVDKAECVKSDMTSLKASFSFSTIEAQDYQSERGTFSWLSLPNTVIGGNEGDPQIPVVNELIAVPYGAQPWVEITSYSTTDYRLEEYGMKTLVPRQPSLRKDKNPEEVPFVYNASAYQSTRGFRSEPMATVNVMGTMRGVQLGKMTIEPVSYDPVNNTIRVFNNIEVTVHFDGADAVATEKMLVDTYSPYFDVVYKQLFNERAVRDAYSDHPDLYNTPVKMLVVATSAYQNTTAFQNWLTWKKQKGIYVDIYTVTSSTASSTIQTEIYSRYNTNHPTFLVIVGDETVVKAYKTNWSCGSTYGNCINDLEYASVDGDVYHDMFMSRMSVSSTTELANLVNKILTYEKYTMSDPTYLNNSLLIAGWDSNWTNKVGKPTIQYANNNYYNSAHGINPTVYITTGSGQTAAYNNINNVGFMNYTAHGDIQELADPEFTNSNANSMTNNDKYLWVVANCCLTANWGNSSYSPCLGETMIRAANKGAFGYIGSIPESYWYEDYYFGVGAFSYVAGTVQTPSSTTTGMYDAAFDDTGFNTLNSMPYIGNVAVTYAHAAGYTSSVTDEYYWRAYQCLGDGSVMPYLNNPSANSVSHASTINIGATSFQVNAHPGSYVAITKNNEILGVAQANASGIANVPITGLTSAGDVMIVVTRNQRQPYITTIQAVSVNGPYITLDSYTPNIALVNQSTNLSLTFKNVGNAATSGTTIVTLTGDSNVTIGTGTKTFSSLAVNASTTVSGFSFTIKPSVTVGSNVTLHYSAVNGSNTWEGDLTVTANQIYTVTVASNNNDYGTVNGGGQYNYNQSCTVTATPADGYMFTSWTQNGSIVSTEASYTFNVTADTDLVANFASGVMIGSGTDTNENLPSNSYYNYTLSEQIYTKAELGSAGAITSIAFYNGGSAKTRTFDIYMKSTTKSSFSGSTDWISVSSSDKVFSGSVTMVAGDWTTITFTTPFVYDGNSNVVLVTDDNTGSYSQGMACRVFSASSQALYVRSDGTNYNPNSPSSYNGTVLSVKNQVILTKEPISTEPVNITVSASPAQAATVSGGGEYTFGQTCTVAATPNAGYTFTGWTENGNVVSTELSYSFTATADRNLVANFIQAVEIGTASSTNSYLPTYNYYNYSFTEQIYTAQEIGVAGTINGIAFYNEGTEKTRTLDLYVKATTKSTFSSKTDWVSMSNSDKVFSGSVTFTTGAWTFINFTTPFEYDGASNIIIAVDDNTGSYTNSPHMACSVFSASSQAIYIYSDGTNYTPSSPTTSQSSGGYDLLSVKNHILVSIEANAASSYDVTVSANPAEGGIVSGEGTYDAGATVTLTATANEGYTFTNWTKNGTVVSSNATYSFTVNAANSGAYVANFTINSYTVTVTANPAEYGTVTLGIRNRDDLVYDFEDGWQGWTTFQGNTTSPNSWMHNTEYPTSNNDFTSGYGYNNSDGFMLSESYISGTSSGSGTAVTPDNYLVSPLVRLGGSVSFYAGARNTSYCAEKFSVMVSTTGNTDAASFTTVGTWTLSLSQAGYNDTPYTVDLSAYSGMGYIAIRHFDCYDQWFLAVDNITVVEGQDQSIGSGTFNYGETCVVTATPTGDYHFVNWTENGTPVSSDATYSFTVTGDRDLVANFAEQAAEVEQTVMLTQGWSWWSTNLDITLEDLEDAIAAAVGTSGTATIKSKSGSITYSNGHWRESGSTTMTLDIRQMYKIQTSTACQITLTGVPVNPAAYEITVNPGNNWIGFPCGESMSVTEAFSGLNPADGDVIKGMNGNARYSNGNWRSQGLSILEPGQGYIYQSNATESKTFTYGMNAK